MDLVQLFGLPANVFEDNKTTLSIINDGVSRDVIKQVLLNFPEYRNAIATILNMQERELLSIEENGYASLCQSEAILDFIKLMAVANESFNSMGELKAWFNTKRPALNNDTANSLLTSYVGRNMIINELKRTQT